MGYYGVLWVIMGYYGGFYNKNMKTRKQTIYAQKKHDFSLFYLSLHTLHILHTLHTLHTRGMD